MPPKKKIKVGLYFVGQTRRPVPWDNKKLQNPESLWRSWLGKCQGQIRVDSKHTLSNLSQ